MLLEKVKQYCIDLFIKIIDDHNHYVVAPFEYHANYNSYKLSFSFEDWSVFYKDGKQHIKIIAEYVNADDAVIVKFQNEDFDKLCEVLQTWCNEHKTNRE